MITIANRRSVLNQPMDSIGLDFQRVGVAYDHMGRPVGSNVPVFEHRVPNVTVSNLLTGAQSDGGDTLNPEQLIPNVRTGTSTFQDTTGFAPLIGTENISSSTEQAHTGTNSLKCITPNGATGEGVKIPFTPLASTTYNVGTWVYAPNGATMTFRCAFGGATSSINFTGNGTFQWVEINSFTTVDTTTGYFSVRTNGQQGIIFYVDDCRLSTNVTTGFTVSGSSTLSITGETSYKGYRSVKAVCVGSGLEGIYLSYSCNVGVTYTFQARVKAPLNQGMRIEFYDGTTYPINFTGTGDWQLVSITLSPANGGCQLRIRTNVASAISFYVDSFMLEASSTVHDWAYGGSSYSSYKTVYGYGAYETRTNLLTANQSTCGDTNGDTTGITAKTSTETVEYSTDKKIQGNGCIKCTTQGISQVDGLNVSVTVANSTSYTYGIWVWMPLGVPFAISIKATTSTYSYYTGTGDWQLCNVTRLTTGTSGNLTVTPSVQQPTTFYIDMASLYQTAYPLPWVLGGTTVQADVLTGPSSALNIDPNGYSNLLTANQADGTGTLGDTTGFIVKNGTETISSSTIQAHQGVKSLKCITGNNATNEGVRTNDTTVVASTTYTATGWVYADAGVQITCGVGVTTTDNFVSIVITGNGTWQKFTTTVALPAGKTTLRIYAYTSNVTSTAFYLDELQLTATSSSKQWIPGGTQSNLGSGTIEMEVYTNHLQTLAQYILDSSIGTTDIQRFTNYAYLSYMTVQVGNSSTGTATIFNGTILTINQFNKHGFKFAKDSLQLYNSGTPTGTENTNPTIPNAYGNTKLYIGSRNNALGQFNGIIRNIIISKQKRSDADISARASLPEGKVPGLDRQITLYAPLMGNLKAYRTAKV